MAVVGKYEPPNSYRRRKIHRNTLHRCGLPLKLNRSTIIQGLHYERVILNNHTTLALVDNQAKASIITLKYARQRQLDIKPEPVEYLMADGHLHTSLGYVWMFCGRPNTPQTMKLRRFDVFPEGIHPVVLGEHFIYETGILVVKTASPDAVDLSLPVGSRRRHTQSYVHVLLNKGSNIEKVMAILDKGSNINALSLECAKSLGFSSPSLCNRHPRYLQIANGGKVQYEGTMTASVSLGVPPKWSRQRFFVIRNLPYDLGLGNPFITKRELLRKSQLKWTERSQLHPSCYGIIRRQTFGMKSKESSSKDEDNSRPKILTDRENMYRSVREEDEIGRRFQEVRSNEAKMNRLKQALDEAKIKAHKDGNQGVTQGLREELSEATKKFQISELGLKIEKAVLQARRQPTNMEKKENVEALKVQLAEMMGTLQPPLFPDQVQKEN